MSLPRCPSVSAGKAYWLLCVLFIAVLSSYLELEAKGASSVVARQGLSLENRKQLVDRLRAITGWTSLDFDSNGALLLGSTDAAGGSVTARRLVAAILQSQAAIVLEESSKRPDIAFCQVSLASWKKQENGPASTVYVVSIDFADFGHLNGHPQAVAAFDVGWVVLHEFDHILNNSSDADLLEDVGECEAHINQMRQECGLPIRAQYFFANLPLTAHGPFVTNWVRLAFEERSPNARKKRYWLVWDAGLVGGTIYSRQVASMQSR